MAEYAKIIVKASVEELDRIFDYRIPDFLENVCQIGVRVIIPFGPQNRKREGYVLALSDETEVPLDKMKSVMEVLDQGAILFSKDMIELAFFMKRKYFTTLNSCLQTIIPSGIHVKSQYMVYLQESILQVEWEICTPKQREILEMLKEQNGIEIGIFQVRYGKDTGRLIKALEQLNFIYREQIIHKKTYAKEVNFYILQSDSLEYNKIKKKAFEFKRLAGQRKIFELFEERNEMSALELKQEDISQSALNTLIRHGVLKMEKRTKLREVFKREDYGTSQPLIFTKEQEEVYKKIVWNMERPKKKPVLLHGVTGSGKTEVYLQTIAEVLERGQQAIILVSEISLTPQMMDRLISRFGDLVSVTHSKLSTGERYDQWKKARDGEISVIVGPRSALFMPFANLGAIIIDEVHEDAYVSEVNPKYDARDVALELARITNSLLLMGSATPPIDMYYRALKGEYELLQMKSKIESFERTKVFVVDMKEELREGNRSIFSRGLQEEMEQTLSRKEQVMLFLNRRGYSTFVSCRSCGFVMECEECALPYTYHQHHNELMCHYCGRTEKNPTICPECGSNYIKYFGNGTQKLEEEVKKLFPQANVLRMDFDTVKGKMSYQTILKQFENQEADILLGTQMIAKGHDFKNVTLMGIISADNSLYTPSLYNAEQTFQLLTQSAGRAGRSEKGGKVYMQTYKPEHYAIQYSRIQSYEGFYQQEIAYRELMQHPPFGVFVSVILMGKQEDLVKRWADILATEMSKSRKKFQILGPVPTRQRRIDGEYWYRILVQGTEEQALVEFVLQYVESLKERCKKQVSFNLTLNPRYIV